MMYDLPISTKTTQFCWAKTKQEAEWIFQKKLIRLRHRFLRKHLISVWCLNLMRRYPLNLICSLMDRQLLPLQARQYFHHKEKKNQTFSGEEVRPKVEIMDIRMVF